MVRAGPSGCLGVRVPRSGGLGAWPGFRGSDGHVDGLARLLRSGAGTEPEDTVDLDETESAVDVGHRDEHLGVQFDLVEGDMVVKTIAYPESMVHARSPPTTASLDIRGAGGRPDVPRLREGGGRDGTPLP